MSLAARRQQLAEDLALIEDAEERFGWIIDSGRRSPGLPPELKLDSFKIEGCVSNLWLVPEFRDGLCFYRCDGDSLITKGVGTMLCKLYSGATAEEVLAEDAAFLADLGVTQHLTQNRRNGLSNLRAKIHDFARSVPGRA